MLLKYYEKSALHTDLKPQGEMKVDGIYGGVTANWILKFQLDMSKRSPGKIAVDGRIDRIRDKTSFHGSITRTTYTLAALNYGLRKYNPEAFIAVPALIPLENPHNVPPPSNDVIYNEPVPTTGGF